MLPFIRTTDTLRIQILTCGTSHREFGNQNGCLWSFAPRNVLQRVFVQCLHLSSSYATWYDWKGGLELETEDKTIKALSSR